MMYNIVIGANHAANNNAPINITFNNTGINATSKNLENAFKMADKNADAHINTTYQNIMREITTVNCILPGSSANPGANIHTTIGIKISNKMAMNNKITISQENTFLAKYSSLFRSVYIGMNMDDNAPSPNKSRNKLGNLNAAKNTSDRRPAPKTCATNKSRTKPKTRLMPVITLTPKICLPRLIVWIILPHGI